MLDDKGNGTNKERLVRGHWASGQDGDKVHTG
jgi:hypothetical protein